MIQWRAADDDECLIRLAVSHRWRVLIQQLVWHYGPERARRILLRQDSLANMDIGRWCKLGRDAARRKP